MTSLYSVQILTFYKVYANIFTSLTYRLVKTFPLRLILKGSFMNTAEKFWNTVVSFARELLMGIITIIAAFVFLACIIFFGIVVPFALLALEYAWLESHHTLCWIVVFSTLLIYFGAVVAAMNHFDEPSKV